MADKGFDETAYYCRKIADSRLLRTLVDYPWTMLITFVMLSAMLGVLLVRGW